MVHLATNEGADITTHRSPAETLPEFSTLTSLTAVVLASYVLFSVGLGPSYGT